MTATKFRIISIIVFLAVIISVMIWAPSNFLNIILWFIACWQIGGWVFDLSDKLARKYGFV